MKHLLNLLAAVALLVWGTHMVRTGVLRVFGANLRNLLARSMGNRVSAMISGIGVTALVQSSTATSLMTSSFVGQGLITLPSALAVMRGADVGTAMMSVLFATDLSWLSPLLIFVGVVLFITRQDSTPGRIGRVLIGLGVMLLALRLVVEATEPLVESPVIRTLLGSMTSDIFLELLMGAVLAIMAYSSLAIVLLIAAMASSGAVPLEVALGLVLGANLGSGMVAVLTTAKSSVEVRQVTIGNMLFKLMGVALALPCIGLWMEHVRPVIGGGARNVVLFHLAFNVFNTLFFIGMTHMVAKWVTTLLPKPEPGSGNPLRPRHLDASALATPSLAISCAAREALHQADVVEAMLIGMHKVVVNDDLKLSTELRHLDDTVDELYSAIKYYMTKISRAELDEKEGQRWTEVISFTINMEQIGDLIERVLQDIETKKIRKGRQFSAAGMQEINDLHARLLANLRLAMSVFLTGNVRDAQKLLEEKARFRDLELAYSASHLARLSDKTVPSIETSSLHIDLISELKRINSLLCSVAYPILESAGALAPSRLRETPLPQQK
ncbi:Na/Pi cotransporter family protein [Comamonas endophytica]|uniref:Na/Pi cotransporter family protein n=1 Tax=Comamonas endophytica TaxID=2949090 RepID=A0ABY6GDK6_9BURK|nr:MULTISPECIES: Na/Pi cotransporter family protein [unclassified Acidovorax]MCD2513096.1 Na/Pi cotransporter family protein [Acidovorax sp. D4N7]UYG52564.1 Na/Pi cotransporter family protein [Acidovorax sp. 5MLIR]